MIWMLNLVEHTIKIWMMTGKYWWFFAYPSEKYESVGIMKFPIYGKIKAMFQTTNQLISGGIPPIVMM